MSKYRRLVTFFIFFHIPFVCASNRPSHQIVVEKVSPDGEAARAGLREGDILSNWSRGDTSGTFDFPFDISDLEILQSPLGPITIEGQRAAEHKTWTLTSETWDLQVRPNFPDSLLKMYQSVRTLPASTEPAEAVAAWRKLLKEADDDADQLWLWSRAAALLSDLKQWNEVDEFYKSAMQQADALHMSFFEVQLCRDWARAFERRNDPVKAEQYYRQSADTAEHFYPDTMLFAATLEDLARFYRNSGKLPQAEEYLRRTIEIEKKLIPESLRLASSENRMGLLAMDRGNYSQAEEYLQRSLDIRQKQLPDSLQVASSLNDLGVVAWYRGDMTEAEHYFSMTLPIREKLAPGSLDLAKSLSNLGLITLGRGDFVVAESYFLRSLEIEEKSDPESMGTAASLDNLGVLEKDRGDLVKAEKYYRRALEIQQKAMPNSQDIWATLLNLGTLAFDRSDFVTARDYAAQSLAFIEKAAPGSLKAARSLNNLGNASQQLGNLNDAESYLQRSLAIKQQIAPNRLDVASTLHNLGDVARTRHDFEKAEKYFDQALAIEQAIAPNGTSATQTLSRIGDIARERGNWRRAKSYYLQAITIEEKLAPQSTEYGETLAELAKVQWQQKQLTVAAQHFEQAISILEAQTTHLGGTHEVRSEFDAGHVQIYKNYMELLLEQRRFDDAFLVLERSRARSFLEMLAERDLSFSADLSADLRTARVRNASSYDRVQAQITKLNPAKEQDQIDKLLGQLRSLQNEREQIAQQVRQTSPRLSALQYPIPLNRAAAGEVLDPGTIVLSYSIGKKETVLFVLLKRKETSSLSLFRLPVGEQTLRKKLQRFRDLLQNWDGASRLATIQQSESLYDLLVRPAESLIAHAERILIVPDGPLQTLPFCALLRTRNHYLVEWKPIHTITSVTVYGEIKKMRQEKANGPVQLVAFGDPHYPSSHANSLQNSGNMELRSELEQGLLLTPLPFSRDEVNAISEFFPNQSHIYLGDDATEERAKSIDRDARYIHFATHAYVDEKFPLNSSLILALPEQLSDGIENGLLQAWEIFEQLRINADLVTLSGCDTGLGKERAGEGLIGLTRAFQYAGAHSVLATLWQIPDASTAVLMKHFYAHLKSGDNKDEALRHAQIEFLHLPQFSRPFYWAAFSMSGDWR